MRPGQEAPDADNDEEEEHAVDQASMRPGQEAPDAFGPGETIAPIRGLQ